MHTQRRNAIERGNLRGARTFDIPTDAVVTTLGELDRTFADAHFRARAVDPASGALRLYRRGSIVGDVLIGGTGLSLVTRRIGPLSALGVVVVWAGDQGRGISRVIVSLVAGSEVGADVVDAVQDAVQSLVARGITLTEGGWSRAVDVDPALPVNPRRAAELGLR
ncbi:hypothetical protein [Microbacterium sp. NPDC090003]|uniref:hypothetical protein n=1 Tax=Microbacterium sp. NPDC090003 TaxID=3364203 RepID=UPI00381D5DCB